MLTTAYTPCHLLHRHWQFWPGHGSPGCFGSVSVAHCDFSFSVAIFFPLSEVVEEKMEGNTCSLRGIICEQMCDTLWEHKKLGW